jgi:cysteine-rich repeat protein
MKKLILTIAFLLIAGSAQAAVYYVRSDGGTGTQCTGLTNAAYPGSGTGQACAFNHPNWPLPASNGNSYPAESTTYRINGGDTVVIAGPDDAGTGVYKMGCQAVSGQSGSSFCRNSSFNYNVSVIGYESSQIQPPSGTASQRTIIVGCSVNGCGNNRKPELWGSGSMNYMFDISSRHYITFRDLDLTDHYDADVSGTTCRSLQDQAGYPGNSPCAKNAFKGFNNPTNITWKGVNMHGFSSRGLIIGGLGDSSADANWLFEDSNIDGNLSAGLDLDICSLTGQGVGCNNRGVRGDVKFIRTTMRWNGCSEAYPLNPHPNPVVGNLPRAASCITQGHSGGYGDMIGTPTTGGNWLFEDGIFSHNTSDAIDLLYLGRQASYGPVSLIVKRSLFEGNNGNAIKGPITNMEDNLIVGNCEYWETNAGGFELGGFTECRAGGTPIVMTLYNSDQKRIVSNTILSTGDIALQISGSNSGGVCNVDWRNNIFQGGFQYNQDRTAMVWTNTNPGETESCTSGTLSHEYNICNGFKNYRCTNSNEFIIDPLFTGPMFLGNGSFQTAGYYTGEEYYLNLTLQETSPAIEVSDESAVGADPLDWQCYPRGVSWDAGAIEFGSVDSCGAAPVCGDSIVNGTEVCDGSNLNGETCVSRGFDLGGTLACAANCSSFNTTGCASSSCGNGVVELLEECDDGNNVAGDGCDPFCRFEVTPGTGVTITGTTLTGTTIR